MWGETRRRVWVSLAVLIASALGGALCVEAAPLQRSEVPEPLRPWIDWALRGAEDNACPLEADADAARRCVFATSLSLDVGPRAGTFRAEWRVARESWVLLPGDASLWPQEVRLDDKPAVVALRGDRPAIHLAPGSHKVSGTFAYAALPEGIAIPPETALVALRVSGERVAFPRRDDPGRVWLRERAVERGEPARLDVSVNRRVTDSVPLIVETRIELRVSGNGREVVLGPVLPPELIPVSLQSELPARLEPSRTLRVQVRPGTFEVRIRARAPSPVTSLSPPAAQPPWDDSEVWVFEAQPEVRVVEVEGVAAVDPQQTTLPPDWRHFPAYVVGPGAVMKLNERRRGDADPAPDELALERTLWLDFDGNGFTAHDAISGRLSRSWRLEMAEPVRLGRVAIDGRDQLITRTPESPLEGVEIRQGSANVEADSRIEGPVRRLPAVGWAHDFASVTGHLMLPPGWRVIHASGVDRPMPTWLEHWTMLEIFLALITALAVSRLHGRVWGAVALVALVLLYPEPGAPHYAWLFVLGADALARLIPEGRMRTVARALGLVAAVALVIIAVPFAVTHLRAAMYPSLELGAFAMPRAGLATPASRAPEQLGQKLAPESAAEGRMKARRMEVDESFSSSTSYYEQVPGALVSTGPGLPAWQWREVELSWAGPVARAQELRLWLVPPWLNFALGFVRVGLLALLAVVVFGLHRGVSAWRDRLRGDGGAAAALLALVLSSLLLAPAARAADFPPKELLDSLAARLSEKPECAPGCVTSPRLVLEVEAETARVRVELHAAAYAAAPLPGGAADWLPETVSVDGAPAAGLARDANGGLWLELAPGVHQVVLEGRLPPREAVQIPLPLRPARVEARVNGWLLSGVDASGRPEASLQLARPDRPATARAELEPTELPPFARVTRVLHLGLVWTVETRVDRVSPPTGALFVAVPLLTGESVTTDSVRVENAKAQVSLAPGVASAGWTSSLVEAPKLALRAPNDVPWTEVWALDVSPVWHAEVTGIAPLAPAGDVPLRARRWQPWPGESLEIALSRPQPSSGPTLTLDRAALHLAPGLRGYEATLDISLRASRGDTHTLTLPEGAELLSVAVDGTRLPIALVGRHLVLPVQPGSHSAEIAWRAPRGIGFVTRTPSVDVGAPVVNTELELDVSRDRWVWFVGGPRLGPAVLYWSLLAVAGLLAFGLSRSRLTPLGVASWFLLFVGLSQVPIYLALVVAGWLVALGWRRAHALADAGIFDFVQIVLAMWTAAALGCLVIAVHQGLLGLPEMQISGNGSSGSLLRWYQDRSASELPTAWAVSVPLLVYRFAMLAWALWLAVALLRWLRWGWDSFSSGGAWRHGPPRPPRRSRRSAEAPTAAPPA
jgi:hypothetical protein